MIVKMNVQTKRGASLNLYTDPVSQSCVLEKIDGLDPVKATMVSSSFAQMDGEQYQSSRRSTRNIVISIGLLPDYVTETVRSIRQKLYSIFMPKSEITMSIEMLGGDIYTIEGHVESFETDFFSPDPAISISILCFDPDFIDPEPVVISNFSNTTSIENEIFYEGSIDTGFVFKLMVDRQLSEFTLYQRTENGSLRQMDFQENLLPGDVLSISTIPGNKYVQLNRSNTTSSLLYALSPQSAWLAFEPGENRFRVYAEGAPIRYTIEYFNRYGGL